MYTTVGIVGAGPAGLLLARLLHKSGIDCVILEGRDRAHCEQRQRAGLLEQATVEALRSCGAAERLDREGFVHDGIELRFNRRSHRIDFPSLTGGRRVTAYAQTEIVKDLIYLQLAAGVPILFEARVHGIDDAETRHPRLHYTHDGREHTLTCEYVIGADGWHGVTRDAIPAAVRRTYERVYPYSWLTVLADAAPSDDELIYAHSPRGFALHGVRSPSVSRFYLQVPNGTDPDAWSDERIWDELDARLAIDGGRPLSRGPISAKAVLPLRSLVTEPMRHGRVLLIGDAAHVVLPTGAKGLNLAAADAVALARALIARYEDGSNELLAGYSDTSLRRVWRAVHFSCFLTRTMHTAPDQDAFTTRLQLSQLDRIATSRAAARELAEDYTGPLID